VTERSRLLALAIFLTACDKRPAEAPVDAAPSAAPVVTSTVPPLTPTSGKRACGADLPGAPDASAAKE